MQRWNASSLSLKTRLDCVQVVVTFATSESRAWWFERAAEAYEKAGIPGAVKHRPATDARSQAGKP